MSKHNTTATPNDWTAFKIVSGNVLNPPFCINYNTLVDKSQELCYTYYRTDRKGNCLNCLNFMMETDYCR